MNHCQPLKVRSVLFVWFDFIKASPTVTGRPYPLHLSLMINMAHLIPSHPGETRGGRQTTPELTHSEAEIILFDGVQVVIHLTRFAH